MNICLENKALHKWNNETDSISQSTNTLGKDMNPIILPSAMGK